MQVAPSALRMNLYFPSCLTAQTTVVILDSSTSFSSFRPLVLIRVLMIPLSSETVSEWHRMIMVRSSRMVSAWLTIAQPFWARSDHAERLSTERLSTDCMARIRISSATMRPFSVSITTYLMCLNLSSVLILFSRPETMVKLSELQ